MVLYIRLIPLVKKSVPFEMQIAKRPSMLTFSGYFPIDFSVGNNFFAVFPTKRPSNLQWGVNGHAKWPGNLRVAWGTLCAVAENT